MTADRLYVVATRELQARLSPEVLERASAVYDPRDAASAPFLLGLGNFDPVVYEQHGLTLPRWALYDCAAIPGLICGIWSRVEDAHPSVVRALDLPADYTEPVPLTCCIAIPTLQPAHWLAYSIAGLSEVLPAAGDDRREHALRFAVELLGRPRVSGATQWHSTELDVAVALGPLRLRAAWAPAHSDPATLVYDLEPGADIEGLEPFEVCIDRPDELIAVHRELEAGREIFVAAPLVRSPARSVATLLRRSHA